MTKVTVNKTIELLLAVPGDWTVSYSETGVMRAESPDGLRYAFVHSDGRPTYWRRHRHPPEFLVVACPTCGAPVGKFCHAVSTGSSTDVHVARREAARALAKSSENL